MASAPIEFQQKLTLRHIATVKTIQMLWRTSAAREAVKKHLNSRISRWKLPKKSQQKLLRSVTTQLGYFLAKLDIPGVTKNDLSVFLVEMVEKAVQWLLKTVEDMITHSDKNCSRKMEFFVDNFSWDDVGCVDGRAILKSYVSDKDTIDFNTWSQLCFYCIEEDIERFSRTMDWDKCRKFTKSYFPIFWYQKIYGKFPTKKMFISNEFSVFENERKRGVYNRGTIIQNLISESVFQGNISGVKYFRSVFGDDEKFQRLFSEGGVFFTSYPAMMVYLLGEVKDEALLQSFCASGDEFAYLLHWPWILFVDTWISKIENMCDVHFRLLFEGIYGGIRSEREKAGTVEFGRRRNRGFYCTRFYEPFRKFWGAFCQKFGGGGTLAREVFLDSFQTEDFRFCRIILEDLGREERRFFLDALGDSNKRFPLWRPLKDFREEFVREVLIGDEERSFFEKIFPL